MWAIRRAPNPLKQGSVLRSAQALVINSSNDIDNKVGVSEYSLGESDGCLDLKRFHHTRDVPAVFSVGRHGLSSQAGAKWGGEGDELEVRFSELQSTTGEYVKRGNEDIEDEMFSAPELSAQDDVYDNDESTHIELEVPDTETEGQTNKSEKKKIPTKLSRQLAAAPGSIHGILDKWVEEGNVLDRSEISSCMLRLRKIRLYWKALQLLDWLESNKRLKFGERDYASRVDLIAKVRGTQKAEKYIEQIPESFRGEPVYRALLASYAMSGDVKKAEEVFDRMKDLKLPITTFSCNQLLLFYKRIGKKKIGDILLLMDKESVKPSLHTYKILIDAKGCFNDITGMDHIVESMKAEGIEPDLSTQALLAQYYFSGGLKEKAENLLKKMEGENLNGHRSVCQVLLPLYGELGDTDEVERIWKFVESGPRLDECMAAIEAYGKLNNIEKAEAVFQKMSNTWKRLSSEQSFTLLKVYMNNKMLGKAKDLVKLLADTGCQVGPETWDALVKLYVEAGEVEKADLILHKATQKIKLKPLCSSYITIMEHYAKRGDIHNTEKIFYRMKLGGYSARLVRFKSLLEAYVTANSPAYGIRERMKAENVFPNKALAAQLTKVDPFRQTARPT